MKRALLLVLASLGVSASAIACSGAVESTPAAAAVVPEAAPPVQREAGVTPPEEKPPVRDVNAPLVIDLGKVAHGQDVTLKVPVGALGFNVVVESKNGGTDVVGIERITSPSGEVVHELFTPKGGSHATSESSFGSIASASVPQSEAKSANTPEPGTWTIRIGGAGGIGGGGDSDAGTLGPATLHAEARIQMGSTTGFAGGRLDVNVFVPTGVKLGNKTLDSESAATNEGIASRLDTFFNALSEHVGIDRGDVTFLPVKAQLKYVDDYDLLLEAFAASTGRPDNQSLSIMLTNGIDLDGGGAWGIAPGIPGVPARSGTPMSGIVLAIGDTPAVGDGLTMLHEAGHFFGLNHTTEFYGGYADPLGDTPRCDDISLDDPTSFQKCPDKKNVMFPAFYGTAGSAVVVSDAQRAVFRGSPIYKAYKDPLPAMSTMGAHTSKKAAGERITLARSGRALTPVETWLSASLCGHASHGKLDPAAFAGAQGRPQTIDALRAAAVDADLPEVMRKKASAALRALTP